MCQKAVDRLIDRVAETDAFCRAGIITIDTTELIHLLCRIARQGLISVFALVQPMVGNRYTAVDTTDI